MVECDLAKVEVAGSNPVSRSRKLPFVPRNGEGFVFLASVSDAVKYHQFKVRRGTQVVRERSAKPLCVGSIPTRASNPFNNLHISLVKSERGLARYRRLFSSLLVQWIGSAPTSAARRFLRSR